MTISPISRSYWRLIKAGARTYSSVVGDDKKAQVHDLARQDVAAGIITPEQHVALIGEVYQDAPTA